MLRIVAGLLIYLMAATCAVAQRGAEWASRGQMVGVNVTVLANAGWDSTTWAATVATSAHLDDIQAQGYQWIRIAFSPATILTTTTVAAQDQQIAILRDAIYSWVKRGKKVLLDAHTSDFDTSGWHFDDIISDYPSGAKWLRYRQMTQRIMMMLRAFPDDMVAYQQWNEVVGTPANWSLAMADLQRVGRSSGNRKTWVLISGDRFSAPDGLSDLVAAHFDARSLFGVTPYTWQQVWIQGAPSSISNFVYGTGSSSQVSFPPILSDAVAAKGAIDADGTISGPDKTTFKGYVDSYTSSDGTGYISTELAKVSAWADAARVPRYRMISTEDGSHGDYATGGWTAGGTTATRANLALAIHKARLANGVVATAAWHYDPGVFQVVQNGGFTFEPALLVSRGLTPTNAFETETNTLISAITVPPNAYRQALMNSVVKMLKDAGIWSKLAFLYLRGDTDQMVTINWKNPGSNTLTASTGAMAYANAASGNGRVLSCDGTNTINSAFDNNVSPRTLNSQSGGAKRLTASSHSGIDFANSAFGEFAVDMTSAPALGWHGAGGTINFSNTSAQTNHTSQTVHGAVSRASSAGYSNYVDGSLIEAITQTSTSISATPLLLCQFSSPLPDGQFSVWWAASGLTDIEIAQVRTITEFYENAF